MEDFMNCFPVFNETNYFILRVNNFKWKGNEFTESFHGYGFLLFKRLFSNNVRNGHDIGTFVPLMKNGRNVIVVNSIKNMFIYCNLYLVYNHLGSHSF